MLLVESGTQTRRCLMNTVSALSVSNFLRLRFNLEKCECLSFLFSSQRYRFDMEAMVLGGIDPRTTLSHEMQTGGCLAKSTAITEGVRTNRGLVITQHSVALSSSSRRWWMAKALSMTYEQRVFNVCGQLQRTRQLIMQHKPKPDFN